MIDLTGAGWHKSSHSTAQGNCVEVADGLVGVVGVRDSKDADGPVLLFGVPGWRSFVDGLKAGRVG